MKSFSYHVPSLSWPVLDSRSVGAIEIAGSSPARFFDCPQVVESLEQTELSIGSMFLLRRAALRITSISKFIINLFKAFVTWLTVMRFGPPYLT